MARPRGHSQTGVVAPTTVLFLFRVVAGSRSRRRSEQGAWNDQEQVGGLLQSIADDGAPSAQSHLRLL
eukprot:6877475-Alexandrium_andersonii.AAC.1